jgi:hypothetical protein
MAANYYGKNYNIGTCGQYYKDILIVNYNSSVISKFGATLTDDARVIIYNHHMFIVQATGLKFINMFHM